MKFRMYSNRDSAKETITIINAYNESDAIETFAKVKGLDVESFNELYSVEQYNANNDTTGN